MDQTMPVKQTTAKDIWDDRPDNHGEHGEHGGSTEEWTKAISG